MPKDLCSCLELAKARSDLEDPRMSSAGMLRAHSWGHKGLFARVCVSFLEDTSHKGLWDLESDGFCDSLGTLVTGSGKNKTRI